ncbi:hypothetical protein JOQ06_024065 [Pogonophryne albipinna]|uniref:Uncharacterized protein n=1 Tax=Pogonophryne albipinna TaxID=1090488 RepID=A0AAD6FUZ6_9TELE|nr:hypothetical protein JOQ06_024065 [Pogonophryne albipinna]
MTSKAWTQAHSFKWKLQPVIQRQETWKKDAKTQHFGLTAVQMQHLGDRELGGERRNLPVAVSGQRNKQPHSTAARMNTLLWTREDDGPHGVSK